MSKEQPFILAEDGKPFSSDAKARKALKDSGRDDKKFAITKYQGGWAIADVEALTSAVMAPPEQTAGESQTKYWWVEFNQRQSTNEQSFVPLTLLNRMELRVTRGKEVCLPEYLLEIADHAVQTVWDTSGEGGLPARPAGAISRYPYRRVREGSLEEFQKQLSEGNAIQMDYIERMRKKTP